jgi:hypothetical protein
MDRYDNRIRQHLKINAIHVYRRFISIGKKKAFVNIKKANPINIRELLKRKQVKKKAS